MARRRKKLKGPVRATRAAIVRDLPHRALTREAEEKLFRVAEVLSEGGSREGSWFGSTMITFDLDRLAAEIRGPLDAEARAQLLAAVEGSVRMRIRVMRLALAEVSRRFPGRRLGTAQVETRIRLHEGKLHVDVDLEVPFGVSSGRRR
jgi:hypothetical protein